MPPDERWWAPPNPVPSVASFLGHAPPGSESSAGYKLHIHTNPVLFRVAVLATWAVALPLEALVVFIAVEATCELFASPIVGKDWLTFLALAFALPLVLTLMSEGGIRSLRHFFFEMLRLPVRHALAFAAAFYAAKLLYIDLARPAWQAWSGWILVLFVASLGLSRVFHLLLDRFLHGADPMTTRDPLMRDRSELRRPPR